jgi:hypothetical protein
MKPRKVPRYFQWNETSEKYDSTAKEPKNLS